MATFYGNKEAAAELAGVDVSSITDAYTDAVNKYIDVLIRQEGFVESTADEYYDIYKSGQDELVLKNMPVTEFTELISDANTDTPLSIDTNSYVVDLDSAILQLISTKTISGNGIAVFTQGKNSVRCKYKYGYVTVPADIAQFATLLVARWKKVELSAPATGSGEIKSIRIGDYAEAYDVKSSWKTEWDGILQVMHDNLTALYSQGV